MKKIFLTYISIITTLLLFGQQQNKLPDRHLQFAIGRSKHGTGDVRGISFNSVYSRYFQKKFSWIVEVGGTLHDGSFPVFYPDQNGNTVDGSIYWTTGGIQATGNLAYSFIRSMNHELQVRLGGLLRYQSTSYPDELAVLHPILTGLPYPVVYLNNRSPTKTFAVGGTGAIAYIFTLKKMITLGVLGGFQTDTNGDTISQIALTIGKRF